MSLIETLMGQIVSDILMPGSPINTCGKVNLFLVEWCFDLSDKLTKEKLELAVYPKSDRSPF